MTTDNLHKQIADLVKRAEDAAYERGKADAKRELLAFLGAKPSMQSEPAKRPLASNSDIRRPPQDRQRAPKGIVPQFVRRVLSEHTKAGQRLTPQEIIEHAETDFEKMIKVASVRGELRAGRDAGRYREIGGRWLLANGGEEKEEAETPSQDFSASVFD